MPILYKYDEETKEYIGSIPACEDPMASMREGKPVYAILKNSTLEAPSFEEGKIPVFDGKTWKLKPISLEVIKDSKIKEISKLFEQEFKSTVSIEGLEVNYFDKPLIFDKLKSDEKYILWGDKVVKREALENASKYLYIRGILLTFKKNELIEKVQGYKSKKAVENLDADFNIEKDLDKFMSCDIEEFEKFLEGETEN